MPEKLLIVESDVPEGAWWTCLDRVVGPDDNTILASQVDGSPPYVVNVYDSADLSLPVYTRNGVLATEVVVPVTQNSYWTVDDDGYTFFDIVKADGTHFVSTGGRTYIYECRLSTSQFGPIIVKHVFHSRALQST